MKRKNMGKKDNKKLQDKCSEELSFYEPENRTEELLCTEKERDCFSEGGEDDRNIISRVILF